MMIKKKKKLYTHVKHHQFIKLSGLLYFFLRLKITSYCLKTKQKKRNKNWLIVLYVNLIYLDNLDNSMLKLKNGYNL